MSAYSIRDPRKVQKRCSIRWRSWIFGNQDCCVAFDLVVGMTKFAWFRGRPSIEFCLHDSNGLTISFTSKPVDATVPRTPRLLPDFVRVFQLEK